MTNHSGALEKYTTLVELQVAQRAAYTRAKKIKRPW